MYTAPSDQQLHSTVSVISQEDPTKVSDAPADVSSLAHLKHLKVASVDHPLNVVILHGDPTKPNDILPGGKWDEDDFYTVQRAKEALKEIEDRYRFTWLCNHDTLIDDLRKLKKANKVDIVLQLCDEGWMNNSRMELHITALLEMLEIPYTGASPKCIGITYDKQGVLKIAESLGVPVPKSVYLESDQKCDPVKYGLEFPVIVKPNSTDGSFGITAKSVCHNVEEVRAAIDNIRNVFFVKGAILVQEFLTGRDINVGVMEKRDLTTNQMEPWVLPITEEDYSALPDDLPKICGFESKWDSSSPYYGIVTRPTTLSKEKQAQVAEWSKLVFRRIDCRDYARFDWRLDAHGNPRLLESNPNCGWCWDGHLPKTAGLCGISYSAYFEMIIKSGLDRAARFELAAEEAKHKKFIIVAKNGAEDLYKKSQV
ncbi:hypothetical protein MP228_010085 [Amoeboaphelidium protococcarum]|nr:hypothetical protein MP228_010085 [Amoeboaphelidium protococcarum]